MAFVLGIAGGTASGKTTLCRALLAALGDRATLVTHDQYYRSLPEGRDPADVNWDHPDTLDTAQLIADIDAYQSGAALQVPDYDFTRHSRTPQTTWSTLPQRPILVVEGILVLEDAALRTRFDKAIFVDTPSDVRLARRIKRDVAERGRTLESVLDQYLATVRPMHERFVQPSVHHADLVIHGTVPTAQLLDKTLSWLAPHLPA